MTGRILPDIDVEGHAEPEPEPDPEEGTDAEPVLLGGD